MNKAYQISFTFDQPQPGVITIHGTDEENARSNFLELMKDFSNVNIVHVTDLESIPFLQQLYKNQMSEQEGSPFIEGEIVEEFKKPN